MRDDGTGRVLHPIVLKSDGDGAAILSSCRSAFGDVALTMILFFAPDGGQVTEVSAVLSDAFGPGCQVMGCSSAGGFAFGGYDDRQIVLIGFPAASFRASAVWLPSLRQHMARDWMRRLRALTREFAPTPGRARFGLLLVDGMSGREELITTTVDATLPDLLVLGGSAGDGLRFERTALALDGESLPESALFCLIETDFAVEEVVFDPFVPASQRMFVTRASPDDRLLEEINAEPAVEEYARLIGVPVGDLGPAVFAANPILERSNGRHFVRAISGVTERGGLTLMSAVETGAILKLGRADSLTLGMQDRLNGLGEVALILGFDCILRRIALEEAGQAVLINALYSKFRIAGFNTYGEQHCGIHVNQTFAGLAILTRGASDAA